MSTPANGLLRPLVSMLLFGAWLVACDPYALRDDSIKPDDLPESGETASGGWQSAPFPTIERCGDNAAKEDEDRWLTLPSRTELNIPHGLGRAPSQVLVYIAFEERGCDATLAAGDVARIKGVDGDRIRLENATTETFSVRLYLE